MVKMTRPVLIEQMVRVNGGKNQGWNRRKRKPDCRGSEYRDFSGNRESWNDCGGVRVYGMMSKKDKKLYYLRQISQQKVQNKGRMVWRDLSRQEDMKLN